ncbi:hypothetical protein M9H77_08688 [Catharanthus roseus]|uniref:Uncharacterized protein n=1 Tax=Catharanthus roseus TaxID=4058 RepID=A0ACC0BYG4_CATRO|nr:hypothetical protein M9H77_08688 [Catharanthus roseus]
MEEVPAHVHPGPIVTNVLSRQHEHRSGLIWSGDRETCYTDLQCRRFGRNLFQCYSAAPRRLDSEISRDAYGPYFTGTIRKSWTLPTNRIISYAELPIEQQNIPSTHGRNTTTLPEHTTAVT